MAEAGPRAKKIRSDCWVRVEPSGTGIRGTGIRIRLESKVASMYGVAIREQTEAVLAELGVTAAEVEIRDGGALPFVLAARIETAVRRAGVEVAGPALPEPHSTPFAATTKERLRRSRLYVPGSQPKLIVNAGLYGADGVILDLEDSVSPAEKDAARILVRNGLIAVDLLGAEQMVRINQLPLGLDDLEWVIPHGVHVVLIPKCEAPEQVVQVDERIASLNPSHPVYLMPIIESALGCFRALEIASASPNVVALTIGLEDYTADIGAQRTQEARESFWARSTIVNAARAAGVQPIDTVYSDVADVEGLRESVLEARGLGFEGKGCIHPRQIPVVHDAFAPTAPEIERATKIVLAFEDAGKRGLGVVSLGNKMIDPPVVKRALHIVELAIATGRLPGDWRSLEEQA